MRSVAIVNPTAGRGVAGRAWRELQPQLPSEVAVHYTEGKGHATELAQRNRADIVYVVGGDGTLSEVATAIAGTDSEVILAPFGTGNDLARTLQLPNTPERWVASLPDLTGRSIDAYRWECGSHRGVGVNVGGCGFDAVVAERINTGYRWVSGTPAYIASVLQTLISYRAAEVFIQVDDETIKTKAMLVAVANCQSYGGGMKIAPHAQVDDGQLEVVVVEEVSRTEFLKTFPKVFSGKHLSHPRVRTLHGSKVRVQAEPALPILVDGEIVGSSPATFEIWPKALKIRVPAASLP